MVVSVRNKCESGSSDAGPAPGAARLRLIHTYFLLTLTGDDWGDDLELNVSRDILTHSPSFFAYIS